MSENNVPVYTGVGFCDLLFVAFLVLKLCNVITWSWWWVTAPLWIPFVLVLIIFLIVAVVLGLAND